MNPDRTQFVTQQMKMTASRETNGVKTILEADLVSYSDIARTLEENLDVHAVRAFEDQIQAFFDAGLAQVRLHRSDVILGTAGDNAILVFDDVALMHEFAQAVQQATLDHNQGKTVESAKRWFRMGSATGDILVIAPERRIVGTTIARSVRLESAAERGELLVDVPTYDALPGELQSQYGPELVVTGKRDERFPARRCAFVEVDESNHPRSVPDRDNPLHAIWDCLDPNLQDAFSIAYNKKRRERNDRPIRISTRDLFQALARINDEPLHRLFDALPQDALPEPTEMYVTNDKRVLRDNPLLSDCVEESLGEFRHLADTEKKVTPSDIFVDISKHGHGPSVSRLRDHGIGPADIENRVNALGISVKRPRES